MMEVAGLAERLGDPCEAGGRDKGRVGGREAPPPGTLPLPQQHNNKILVFFQTRHLCIQIKSILMTLGGSVLQVKAHYLKINCLVLSKFY